MAMRGWEAGRAVVCAARPLRARRLVPAAPVQGRLASLQTLQYYGFVDAEMLKYEVVQLDLECPDEEGALPEASAPRSPAQVAAAAREQRGLRERLLEQHGLRATPVRHAAAHVPRLPCRSPQLLSPKPPARDSRATPARTVTARASPCSATGVVTSAVALMLTIVTAGLVCAALSARRGRALPTAARRARALADGGRRG